MTYNVFSGTLNPTQSIKKTLWDGVCCGSYSGLQGAGNRHYCAVAIQGISKRNPCWPGWRPAGERGQCVYACHRALESSMAQTDASDYYIQIILASESCQCLVLYTVSQKRKPPNPQR